MYTVPSIRTLETIAPDRATARRLRVILGADLTNDLLPEETRRWLAVCYHRPTVQELRLHAANVLLGTHGVEHVPAGRGRRSPAFDYCNTGDAYAPTLIRYADGRRRRYVVASWGDLVERGQYE